MKNALILSAGLCMTNEQKIKVLAEADGFQKIFEDEWGPLRGFKDNTSLVYVVPNYLTSHDAILPVIVKWCTKHGWGKFLFYCRQVTNFGHSCDEVFSIPEFCTMSVEQLSDALIHAMGKWEE